MGGRGRRTLDSTEIDLELLINAQKTEIPLPLEHSSLMGVPHAQILKGVVKQYRTSEVSGIYNKIHQQRHHHFWNSLDVHSKWARKSLHKCLCSA